MRPPLPSRLAAILAVLLVAPGARALQGELRALVGEPVPLWEVGASGLGSFRLADGPNGEPALAKLVVPGGALRAVVETTEPPSHRELALDVLTGVDDWSGSGLGQETSEAGIALPLLSLGTDQLTSELDILSLNFFNLLRAQQGLPAVPHLNSNVSLSDEEKALLGCGPLHGDGATPCFDVELDLLAAAAEAILSEWLDRNLPEPWLGPPPPDPCEGRPDPCEPSYGYPADRYAEPLAALSWDLASALVKTSEEFDPDVPYPVEGCGMWRVLGCRWVRALFSLRAEPLDEEPAPARWLWESGASYAVTQATGSLVGHRGGRLRVLGPERSRAGGELGVVLLLESPAPGAPLGASYGVEAVTARCSGRDEDGDGIADPCDNCRTLPSGLDGPLADGQRDTDGDGIGNACDCDFDQDGACNVDDFRLFLPDLVRGTGEATDMNGDDAVNVSDFGLFLTGFLSGHPGPSGLAP